MQALRYDKETDVEVHMAKLFVNKELELAYPDSFHVMSEEERSKLTFIAEGTGECLSDPENHAVITIGWKTVNGLASFILSQKDMAKNMEAQIRKPMQSFGIRTESAGSKNIGWKKGNGFRYHYEAQGIGMYGESYVVKSGKTFYYLHFYTREETKEQSLPGWEALLASALWKKD